MGLGAFYRNGFTDALTGPTSSERGAQLREAYAALQRQIPLLYAVAIANVIGLYISDGGQLTSIRSPVTPLLLLILWRLRQWLIRKNDILSEKQIIAEFRKTFVFAVIIAGGFSAWGQILLTILPESAQSVVFFSSLAAVGCAYALSSHLSAACAVLLLLGFPIAVRLLFQFDAPHVGMGLSLLLLLVLTWRLLRFQNRTVRDLVSSRLSLRQENARAQAAERESLRLATVDPLTEAPNRRALLAALDAAEAAQTPAMLALIDLDGFKPINDAFGHRTGDSVLKCVAERLSESFGEEATVARMGGDEFAIFWANRAEHDPAEIGAEVCRLIELLMVIEHRPLRVFACCGVVTSDRRRWASADLLSQADLALYAAKATGKGRFVLFSEPMLRTQQRMAAIERALVGGGADDEVRVVFQPVWDLDLGRVVAFEALARWTSEKLGLVDPGEFIPIAEQMDVIGRITDKTLGLALREAMHWPQDVRLSFNVSALQLCELGAAQRLLEKMNAAGFDPKRFQVEVTETALLADFQVARQNMDTLRAAGAVIALDDFGAGHASISYLREMSFDVVKLDGSLITSLATSNQSKKLLRGVIELCRSLGVRCVAEHVETSEQLNILRELGCDFVQGYLTGRPDTAAELGKYLPVFDGRRAA